MPPTAQRLDTENYLALFLKDTPMIDTRAPVEFARGAFPNAVNLPLMTDSERAQVGTRYKTNGQDAAIQLGHQLVAGQVREQRIHAWLNFARQHPEGVLYCFRGGLRSRICQQWLAEAGCDYPRIIGGYKAMRRFLIDSLDAICGENQFVVLAGRTGSAKTELLRRLPKSVDLEGLARHRGSAFGRRVGGQPAQIDFENHLAVHLLRRHHDARQAPIVLEDEGRFIGRCTLPLPLQHAMARAPVVVLDVDLNARVEHSFKNYILDNLQDWRKHFGEEQGFQLFAEDLRQSLARVRRRLGGVRHAQATQLMEQAIDAHNRGDETLHREWIRFMMCEYYDPMYDYQLKQKSERMVYRGSPEEVVNHFVDRDICLKIK